MPGQYTIAGSSRSSWVSDAGGPGEAIEMAKRPQHTATRDTVDEMESAADASLIQKARVNTISRYFLSTWIRLQPIAGIIALCITIGSMFISLMILVISNGQTTSSWKIQPTVYLAIAAALAIIALNFAYARAVPVAWWYRASQGTTVRELEEQWQSSFSVMRAAFHGRRKMSTIIAASICVPLMFIDGALLQRASSVHSAAHSGLMTMNITLPPELPKGFSGIIADGTFVPGLGAQYATYTWLTGQTVIPSLSRQDSLASSKGSWNGNIAGPGVARSNCTSDTWQISKNTWHDANATWGYDLATRRLLRHTTGLCTLDNVQDPYG
ncbi:hypothetical protein LTR78_006460 [Recurvomyces mirabilis]|uniref:Uncharacterized protein n=1 Tax=Recurvomyces mirabilis TaxID=574656 RepID=A0AAE0WKT6_9PEZI|nr:hypothetical protein LTR78_006460 [Recurvomyces mirabilis]KAK5151120.1 hypothetical protein LTS14_009616 [Recurvomyces mirabilis]